MSGEGTISGCATARSGCLSADDRPAFDQRPGTLDAARVEPASGILVTGSRGTARGGCWAVLCTVRGEDGTFCQVALSIEDARRLAAELVEMADVLEGRIW